MADENELIITIGGTAKEWNATVEATKKKNEELRKSVEENAKKAEQESTKAAERAARAQEREAAKVQRANENAAKAKIAADKKASDDAIRAAQAASKAQEIEAKKASEAAVKAAKEQADAIESVVEKTAKFSAVAFAASAAAIAGVTGSFIDYEKALVGVGKTTNINGEDLEKFGKEFQKMASRIPIATNELLGIAQAAGQLGVRGEENLLKFTDTVGKLGVATDLSGEEAATSLTRILTVTREGVGDIDKFGSVIVALGNNFAASESEIVRVATEVSRSTAVFNVSAAQAAALSAAMKSLGVQAELGGSAVGRVFRSIDASIRGGGAQLQRLSELTGIAGNQLKQAFSENSTAVFQKFIEGIGRIGKEGGDTTKALAQFKLKGEEILKVIPVLALNSELLGKALNMAADEMKNSTALNEEASKAFATLGADTQRLRNDLTTLAQNVGEKLAPSVSELVKGLSSIAKGFSNAEGSGASFLALLLRIGFAISGAVATVAGAALAYIGWAKAVQTLSVAFQAGRVAVIGFTSAATLGLSVILAFLPEIISGIGEMFDAFNREPKTESLDDVTNKLRKLNNERSKIIEDKNTSGMALDRIKAIDQETEALKKLQQERLRGSKDFGTGELLVRPVAKDLNSPFAFEPQTVPLAPEGESAEIENEKKKQTAITQAHAKGVEERIRKANDEAEKLMVANQLRIDGIQKDEADLVAKRLTLDDEKNAAILEKDAMLRDAILAVNKEKFISLDEEERLFYEKKAVRDAEQAEQKKILDQIAREEDVALQDLYTEEDLVKLQEKLLTERQLEQQFNQEKIQKANQARQQQFNDEKKYGTQAAALKKFFAREEVQNFQSVSGDLAQLANSRNSTMKAIGKAAARVNAAIATAEGAIKAYTSLAGIPIVGPALGAAAAAALVAYGVERQAQISAMATGGFVPNAIGGARDRVPTMLEPNELVVPAAIAPNFIQAAGIPDTQANPTKNQTEQEAPVVTIELNERAAEYVTLNQRQGRALGLVGNR